MLVTSRRDRGLVLPLFALTATVMLVMVAFAVDLGAVAERRRASQNMADSAALAAAQVLGTTQAKFASGPARTTAITTATTAALDYVERNGGPVSTASAWTSCTDANALAVASGTTPCVSFSSDLTQVRVRVPDESVPYRFATVVGLTNGTVRSAAVAEVVSGFGTGARPILLRTGTAGINCVEAGGGGPVTPCQGARLDPGDFGMMTSPRYRVVVGGDDNVNLALGLDHALQLSPTNGVNYCDSDNNGFRNKCDNQVGGLLNDASGTHDYANYVVPNSGGSVVDMTTGLVGASGTTFSSAGQSVTALLYRPDGAPASTLVPSGTAATPHISYEDKDNLNGVHISRYLLSSARSTVGCSSAPDASTVPLTDAGYDGCNTSLSTYIIGSFGSTTPVFSADIVDSPRFGIAPVTDSSLGGSSEVAHVVDFYGIYLDRMYGNEAGKVKSLQAFVFPLSMIEGESTGTPSSMAFLGGPFSVRLIR